MLMSGSACAATFSDQSTFSLSTEYNSNPLLVYSGVEAAESLAVLGSCPLTYNTDTGTVDLIPRVRLAETRGNVALQSDYQYLDGDWKIGKERDILTMTGDWHHDSTYYNQFETAALQGHDLRRLEEIGGLDWQHALSERDTLHLTGSWDHMDYSGAASSEVNSFSYSQLQGSYVRLMGPLWQLSATLGIGRYQLLNDSYRSDQEYLQIALSRALTERWSFSAQLGYADLQSDSYVPHFEFVPVDGGYQLEEVVVDEKASKATPSLDLTAEHKGERLTWDFAVSRTLQPSGLGGLLTDQEASIKATWRKSERLTLTASLHAAKLTDSLGNLNLGGRTFYSSDVTAVWLSTEKWTMQLEGTYSLQHFGGNLPQSFGTALYLTFTRQLGRVVL
jgi:hypothetical protein